MYYSQFSQSPYMPRMTQNIPDMAYMNGGSPQMQANNNSIIWVQGEVGAKSYQLPPNSNVLLMDSEDSKFYIKTTDNVGMANLRKFSFSEILPEVVTAGSAAKSTSDFITREEFNAIKEKIAIFEALITKAAGGEGNEPSIINA